MLDFSKQHLMAESTRFFSGTKVIQNNLRIIANIKSG